jgi:hypothetical protein
MRKENLLTYLKPIDERETFNPIKIKKELKNEEKY